MQDLTKNGIPYIFISYSHEDSIVKDIIKQLVGKDLCVWWDEGNPPGKDYHDYIAEKIADSGMVLAFLSENYNTSRYCAVELKYAWDQKKMIVPIYLKECKLADGLGMLLNPVQAMLFENFEKFYEELSKNQEIEQFRSFSIDHYIQQNYDLQNQVESCNNELSQYKNRIHNLEKENENLKEQIENLIKEHKRTSKTKAIRQWIYRLYNSNFVWVIVIMGLVSLMTYYMYEGIPMHTAIAVHMVFILSSLFQYFLARFSKNRNDGRRITVLYISAVILLFTYYVGARIIANFSYAYQSVSYVLHDRQYITFCIVWLISQICSVIFGNTGRT